MSPMASTQWGPSLGRGAGGHLPVTGTSTGTTAGHSAGPQPLLPAPSADSSHLGPAWRCCMPSATPAGRGAGLRALFLCHFCASRVYTAASSLQVLEPLRASWFLFAHSHKAFASAQGVNSAALSPRDWPARVAVTGRPLPLGSSPLLMAQPTSRKASHLQERGGQLVYLKMLVSHLFTAPLTFPFRAGDTGGAGAWGPGDSAVVPAASLGPRFLTLRGRAFNSGLPVTGGPPATGAGTVISGGSPSL